MLPDCLPARLPVCRRSRSSAVRASEVPWLAWCKGWTHPRVRKLRVCVWTVDELLTAVRGVLDVQNEIYQAEIGLAKQQTELERQIQASTRNPKSESRNPLLPQPERQMQARTSCVVCLCFPRYSPPRIAPPPSSRSEHEFRSNTPPHVPLTGVG